MENSKIKNYIFANFKNTLKAPAKNLRYPFFVPGAGYMSELWGWDSYWEARSLRCAFESYGEEAAHGTGISRETAAEHMRGSVLNFLDAQEDDGFIPIMVSGGGLFEGFFHSEYAKGTPINQHLPFLCQSALNASEFCGAFDWVDIEKLKKYMCYFEDTQYDEKSGLFFWKNDIMVGIDNNPTVFYRPQNGAADVFLNCFVYLEYLALARILKELDQNADVELKKAEAYQELFSVVIVGVKIYSPPCFLPKSHHLEELKCSFRERALYCVSTATL